ncbi:MAG: XRE family transcriptional regulator [Nocardioides sp.]
MAEPLGSFAATLRSAIEERGLGLERIRDRLEARGVRISVATLSYWQSGRSQPERKRSLAALPHLEEVLDLEHGTLQRTLTVPRERGRRCAVRGLEAVWPEPPQTAVLRRLDTTWDADLDRISLHDVITIGPDRTQRSLQVREVLRARTDGPDRRVVLNGQDDPRAAPPEIHPRRGCVLGRVAGDVAGVVGAELEFLQPLRRGQTVVVEYDVLTVSPYPHELEFTRRLRLPMRLYLLEVRFDPAALPAACVRISGEEEVAELDLDPAHGVHLLATDTGTTGIRWRWPDRPDAAS